MKSSAFYAVLGIGVIIVAIVIWWGVSHTHKAPTTAQNSIAHTTPLAQVATSSLENLAIYTNGPYGFSLLYPQNLSRQNNFGTSTSNIVQIGTYPNSVTVSVQPGNSSCEKAQSDETEQPSQILQGVTWKVFSKKSNGIDRNYRTIYGEKCYEIQEVAASSSDQVLTGIVQSFTFAQS